MITVDWVSFDLPDLIDDITICQNSTVQLANEIESFSTTYEWSPEDGLSPSANVSGPFATPDVTTTYTLISTAGTGSNACSDTSSVTVTVLPADIDIQPADTMFLCLGESAVLTGNTSNNVTSPGLGTTIFFERFRKQPGGSKSAIFSILFMRPLKLRIAL